MLNNLLVLKIDLSLFSFSPKTHEENASTTLKGCALLTLINSMTKKVKGHLIQRLRLDEMNGVD
jgi:hypothetical protein